MNESSELNPKADTQGRQIWKPSEQVVQFEHQVMPGRLTLETLLVHVTFEYGAQAVQGVHPPKSLPLTVQFAHQSMPYPSSYL